MSEGRGTIGGAARISCKKKRCRELCGVLAAHGLNNCGLHGLGLHRWSAENYKPRCCSLPLRENLRSKSACRVHFGQCMPRNLAPIDRYRPGCGNAMSRTVAPAPQDRRTRALARAVCSRHTQRDLYNGSSPTQNTECPCNKHTQDRPGGPCAWPRWHEPTCPSAPHSSAGLDKRSFAGLRKHTPRLAPCSSAPLSNSAARSGRLVSGCPPCSLLDMAVSSRCSHRHSRDSLHRPRQRLLLHVQPARQQALPGCGRPRARRGHEYMHLVDNFEVLQAIEYASGGKKTHEQWQREARRASAAHLGGQPSPGQPVLDLQVDDAVAEGAGGVAALPARAPPLAAQSAPGAARRRCTKRRRQRAACSLLKSAPIVGARTRGRARTPASARLGRRCADLQASTSDSARHAARSSLPQPRARRRGRARARGTAPASAGCRPHGTRARTAAPCPAARRPARPAQRRRPGGRRARRPRRAAGAARAPAVSPSPPSTRRTCAPCAPPARAMRPARAHGGNPIRTLRTQETLSAPPPQSTWRNCTQPVHPRRVLRTRGSGG